jgi:putative hydrolase of HD superfamily
MDEVLLPLIPTSWRLEMDYFTDDEFANKINDKTVPSSKELNKYNRDEYNPLDGELIDASDKLAAFIEATVSINHGITSKHLVQGRNGILDSHGSKKVNKIDFKYLYDYFTGI